MLWTDKSSILSIFYVLLWIVFQSWTRISAQIPTNDHSEETTFLEDFIICRQCGSDVSLSNFLLNKPSEQAISSSNLTLFDQKVLVQELENPLGIVFRVITVKRATCAKVEDPWSLSYSWFPGYLWKVCLCPKCNVQLGWMYEPIETATKSQIAASENGFYVIIESRTISEKYVNSLLAKEKPLN